VAIILVHASGFPYQFTNDTVSTLDIVNWFSTDVYFALGNIGVPLFVMLTGALLLDANKADESLKVFYKKRFARIGIPFIFWTVIYFVWSFNVHGQPFTLSNIGEGLMGGSYSILWYLYLLMGLYAVTPILRVLLKNLDQKLFTYLLVLWFAGTVVTPLIHTFTDWSFQPLMFVFADWVGVYLLGLYLFTYKVRKSIAISAAILGLLGAIFGDWALVAIDGTAHIGYFHNYLSGNMIIAYAGIFVLLLMVPATKITSHIKVNRVVHWISENTLAIYLMHMIVLETFTLGLLTGGVYLNRFTNNLAIDVPVFVLIVFVVTAVSVYLLKKIPYVDKLIG
jgi:surface polysaccharide O-acyltransferase-like enzyme